MRSILRKLKKSKAGFSFAETLVAILILLMVSSIVAAALPAASNAYTKVVDAAIAQLLLSTTMTVLRDELGTATDVQITTSTITYKSGNTGNISMIVSNATALEISSYQYTENVSGVEVTKYRDTRRLVSEKAATKDMVVTCEFQKGSDGEIIVKDLKVTKNGKELVSREEVTIRPITKVS